MANARLTAQRGYYDRTLLAIITEVDPAAGKVTISFLDMYGVRSNVPFPIVAMSGDSWIRYCPQVSDLVAVGLRPDDSAVILGWVPYNYANRIDSFNKKEPNAAVGSGPEMHQQLKPGEMDMRSKGGSYLKLNAIGDVLIMSLAGRIQMYGTEGFTEVAQKGLKITDGKSWMRFGAPYRLFPLISSRELPTSGMGAPLNKPSDLRERDTRLYDREGNLLIQESLGTVIDESGIVELSGTTGSGSTQTISQVFKGDVAAAGKFVSDLADPAALAKKLQGLEDHIKQVITLYVDAVETGAKTIAAGVQTVYANMKKAVHWTGSVKNLIADVKGVVSGAGAIAGGLDQIRGLGDIGKPVRYRLLINKKGAQVAAYEIDENGGIQMASESPVGIGLNANRGSLTLFGRNGVKMFATALIGAALNVIWIAATELKLVAGVKTSRTAPVITDAGGSISQAALFDASYGAGVSLTLAVGGSQVEMTPAEINVTASGPVNISGGIVTIKGGMVTIN